MAVRIIGIDPGLRRTGWGIVTIDGSRLVHVAHDVVKTDAAAPLAERLWTLNRALAAVIAEHAPSEAAIEETFVNRDAASSLKLGHARGVVLLAIAEAGLACGEYAPNKVKKSVVGRGHADKDQVASMVSMLLNIGSPASADASDALAIAITHAHHRSVPALAAS